MKKYKIKQVMKLLRPLGLVLKKNEHDEFRLNYRGGSEETAYYTDDIDDAVHTAWEMALAHATRTKTRRHPKARYL